jgi:hypothetical protein
MKVKRRKRLEDLEKYRQVLDDLLKNLTKMREIKYNKINPMLAIAGVLIVAMGGVILIYSTSIDVFENQMLTVLGVGGIFTGVVLMFVGYIIAHRGLTGYWL